MVGLLRHLGGQPGEDSPSRGPPLAGGPDVGLSYEVVPTSDLVADSLPVFKLAPSGMRIQIGIHLLNAFLEGSNLQDPPVLSGHGGIIPGFPSGVLRERPYPFWAEPVSFNGVHS